VLSKYFNSWKLKIGRKYFGRRKTILFVKFKDERKGTLVDVGSEKIKKQNMNKIGQSK
jgi:hypothetical protein